MKSSTMTKRECYVHSERQIWRWRFLNVVRCSVDPCSCLLKCTDVCEQEEIRRPLHRLHSPRWDWWVELNLVKDVWKSTTAVAGELCVMTTSTAVTLKSPATVSASGRQLHHHTYQDNARIPVLTIFCSCARDHVRALQTLQCWGTATRGSPNALP